MLIIVAAISLLIMMIMVARPKVGFLILWPVLFCYPQGTWYRLSPLPWNIGFDDLLILLVAALLLVRMLFHQRTPRLTLPVGIALAYVFLVVLSNVIGLSWHHLLYAVPIRTVVREALKSMVFAVLAFCAVEGIDDERDLRRVVHAITLGLFLAAGTVVISKFSPAFAQVFGSPTKVVHYGAESFRAAGALAEPNTVGRVMSMGMAAVFIELVWSRRWTSKIFLLGGALLMVIAVLLARSRVGAVGLLIVIPTVMFLRGMRRWAFTVIALIILLAFLAPTLLEPIEERLVGSLNPMTGEFSGRVGSRFEIWMRHLRNLDLPTLLLGQGQTVAQWRARGARPHSGYVDLLCYYGFPGVVWGLVVAYSFIRRIRVLRRRVDWPMMRIFGGGIIIYLVMVAWAALTGDIFSPGSFELLLLATFLPLVYRADQLVRQKTAPQPVQGNLHPYAGAYASRV